MMGDNGRNKYQELSAHDSILFHNNNHQHKSFIIYNDSHCKLFTSKLTQISYYSVMSDDINLVSVNFRWQKIVTDCEMRVDQNSLLIPENYSSCLLK